MDKLKNKYSLVAVCSLLVLSFHACTDYTRGVHLSKPKMAKSDIDYFERVLNDIRNDIGRFPTTEEGLSTLIRNTVNTPDWKGPYIQRSLNDPWSRGYIYLYPPKYGDNDFDLYSVGANADNDFGGKDDISNWDWEENYLNYYKKLTGAEKLFLYLAVTLFFSLIAIVFIKVGNPSIPKIALRFTLLSFAALCLLIASFVTFLDLLESLSFVTLELAYLLVFSTCLTMALMGLLSSSIIVIKQGFKLRLAAQFIFNLCVYIVMTVLLSIYSIS
jgi:general secretion pathway protein G